MELKDFFQTHRKAALAFSGGVDSAYLLYAARSFGVDIRAYYVKSVFQPEFELRDARQIAKQLHVEMTEIEVDILCKPEINDNPVNRCYYCKTMIFSEIKKNAEADGYSTIFDGTNASDIVDDRPGMRAIQELKVLSPLRECGVTKAEIRRLSKEAGLFTWDKPAYACLATRIRSGEIITAEKLKSTEEAEDFLISLGFSDFRVRMSGNTAKLQVPIAQLEMVMKNRVEIVDELKKYYDSVTLDLEVRNE